MWRRWCTDPTADQLAAAQEGGTEFGMQLQTELSHSPLPA